MGAKGKSAYRGPDSFTKAAKARGYPARSVFKLEEIDRRVRLLRPGQRVLDLGAAPGSWTLFASQRVGPRGRVVSIDLSPIEVPLPANVTFVQGDALASPPDEAVAASAPYAVVLSDMAPKTTGSRVADQARSFELFMGALGFSKTLCAPGGSFVGKLFMSEDFTRAREALRALFDEVRVIRPEGTRSSSFEVFLVGLGRKRGEGGLAVPPG